MGRKTALVISDALGDTACEVVLAAAAQFDEGLFRIVRVPKVADASVVARYLDPRLARGDDLSRSVAASYAGPRAVEDEMSRRRRADRLRAPLVFRVAGRAVSRPLRLYTYLRCVEPTGSAVELPQSASHAVTYNFLRTLTAE